MKDSQPTPPTPRLPPAARKPLTDRDILCLGHLRRIFPLLEQLNSVGCQRDTAGNRQLFFGDYCKLVLLYVWNPAIDSIRSLQQALTLRTVARALGIKRVSLGSFSESPRVFEPDRLLPIIAELAGELPSITRDPRLAELKHALTIVDGTIVRALTRLAKAAVGDEARCTTTRDGRAVYGWRFHAQLDLETFALLRLDRTGARRTGARHAGANRESKVLAARLEPGRCYVGDGHYADRALFDAIAAADSSYVVRLAENALFQVVEERLLGQEALDAGIVRDAVVVLGGPGDEPMKSPVRLVSVQVEPHPRRTRHGTEQRDLIQLAANLTDVPAELVALVYQYRYTVELFFRVLKQLLGLRHLLSQRQEGIDIQVNCTLIVCLLLCLIGGKKPTKANRNMIGWYLIGLATEQELLDHLNKPDNTGVKNRARDERRKKLGY